MIGEISDGGAVVIKDTVVYLGETRLIISGLNNPRRNDDGTVSDIEIDDANSEAKLSSSVLNLDSTNIELKKATGNYEGYTLAVGDDAPEHTPTSAIWEVESGTVTYTAEYPTEGGYIAIKGGTKIIYDSETSTTFEIAGLRNDLTINTETQKIDGFILDYKDVTIPAEAIDSETQITVSGSGYEFHFTTASNVLAGKGTRVIGSSGNDILRTNSAGTFIDTGGGRDTIYAFANEEGVITVRGGGGNSLIFFDDIKYTPPEPESDAGENEPDSNEDDNG